MPCRPSRALLERVADEVDSVVVELKRIVRDLRPDGARPARPRRRASPSSPAPFDDDLQIHLALPPAPVELPAAVEVATYRIVTEAVTNVVRHARAASCWLTIAAGTTVEIDVVDDGVGIGDGRAAGVGLTAMRERAAELGGTVSLLPNDAARHPRPRPAAGGAAVSEHAVPLRVAIVDDHPMFRMGLAAAIDEMDGIELVGEAERADQVAGARRRPRAGRGAARRATRRRRRAWRSTAGWPSTTRRSR